MYRCRIRAEQGRGCLGVGLRIADFNAFFDL